MTPVLAVTFDSNDALLVAAIVLLLVLLAFLAVAETGINRISKVKAAALVEDGRPGSRALLALVEHPERFINPVLLTVNVLQILQTVLITVLAGRLFGAWGVLEYQDQPVGEAVKYRAVRDAAVNAPR